MTSHLSVGAELQSILWIVVTLSAPALLTAMAVGLVVGVLQAVTQIQDQSLPMGAKLLVIAAFVVLAGSWLVSPLVQQSARLFDSFAILTR